MSKPNDINLNTYEKMASMKNMFGNSIIEILKPNIKSHQNESVFKMLEIAKDKPETYMELLSVAIFHKNFEIIKYMVEKFKITEGDSPFMSALSFYNSILPDNSQFKLTEAKENYNLIQCPFSIMCAIGGDVEIFKYLSKKNLISNKNETGIVGLSKKLKNSFYSNMVGAACYYGRTEFLEYILKNYKIDINIQTAEKKSKSGLKLGFSKEYLGLSPPMLTVVSDISDETTVKILKILNNYNCKLKSYDNNKDNIIHLATKNKKILTVKYLIDELNLKSLLNENNKDGYTPLSLAQHLNSEIFINYFNEKEKIDEKEIEENLKELIEESNQIKDKNEKRKKKKNKNIKNDEPALLNSTEYEETLKEEKPNKNKNKKKKYNNYNNNYNTKETKEEEEYDQYEENTDNNDNKENNENDNNKYISSHNSEKLRALLENPKQKKKKKKENDNKGVANQEKKEEKKVEIKEDKKETSKEKEKNDNNNNIKQQKQQQYSQEDDDEFIIGLGSKNKKNKKNKQNYKEEKEKEKEKEKEEKIKMQLEEEKKKEEEERIRQEKEKEKEIEEQRKKEEERLRKILEEKKKEEEEERIRQEKEKEIEEQRKKEEERLKQLTKEKERLRKIFEEKKKTEEEEKERITKEKEKEKEKEQNDLNEEKEEKEESEEDEDYSSEKNFLSEHEESKEKEESQKYISKEDYNNLSKKYLELERRISVLEKEKEEMSSLLRTLFLQNKMNNQISKSENNEENINDLMKLANDELEKKNNIIHNLQGKVEKLNLDNINEFSKDKLKEYKDFYNKKLKTINDALKQY